MRVAKLRLKMNNEMAPKAKIVAYYIRDDKEAIADSIIFKVVGRLNNSLEMSFNKVGTRPGDSINITVTGTPEQRVCMNIVDQSVHNHQNSRLSSTSVFEMVKDMDQLEHDQEWWRLRKRRMVEDIWNVPQTRDSAFAFRDTGLVYLTDQVVLNHKQPIKLVPAMVLALTAETAQAKSSSPSLRRGSRSRDHEPLNRIYFPETWIWHCFTLQAQREVFTLQTPHTVTKWHGEAFGLSTTSGIGLADGVSFTTQKLVFVDFLFPAKSVRFEEVELPITVYSFEYKCIEFIIHV